MFFGFLFKSESISYVQAFTYIGITVIIVSLIVALTRFRKTTVLAGKGEPERAERAEAAVA